MNSWKVDLPEGRLNNIENSCWLNDGALGIGGGAS